MAFTKEQREKAIATRKANAERRKAEQGFIAPASMEGATTQGKSPGRVSELEAEIKRLKEIIGVKDQALNEAQRDALAAAESQGMLTQDQIVEVPSKKTARIMVLDRYEVKGYKDDGREILKPIFKPKMVPTYFYKVMLAPNGGMDMKMNGVELFHGGTYEMDIDTLRSVKEIVYRGWKHEREFRGTDENFYRKQDPNWQYRNAQHPTMIGGRR